MNHHCHLITFRRRSFLKTGEVEVFYIHLKFTQELPIADEKVEDIAKKLPEDTLLFSKSRNISFLSETVTSWRSV